MAVIDGIFFSRRIQYQHSIKFQSLCIFDRKRHNAASENRFFQVAFDYLDTLAKLFGGFFGGAFVPADDCYRIEALALPFFADSGCLLELHIFSGIVRSCTGLPCRMIGSAG